jgi:hypothetical protein
MMRIVLLQNYAIYLSVLYLRFIFNEYMIGLIL